MSLITCFCKIQVIDKGGNFNTKGNTVPFNIYNIMEGFADA